MRFGSEPRGYEGAVYWWGGGHGTLNGGQGHCDWREMGNRRPVKEVRQVRVLRWGGWSDTDLQANVRSLAFTRKEMETTGKFE